MLTLRIIVLSLDVLMSFEVPNENFFVGTKFMIILLSPKYVLMSSNDDIAAWPKGTHYYLLYEQLNSDLHCMSKFST